jgi:hypothetical protein
LQMTWIPSFDTDCLFIPAKTMPTSTTTIPFRLNTSKADSIAFAENRILLSLAKSKSAVACITLQRSTARDHNYDY